MDSRNHRIPCARTLDRPITIWGMEPEELVFLGMASGAVMFLYDPVPAVLLGLVSAFGLQRIKAGKPDGFLFYLLYRSGWIRFFPPMFRVPHLVRPPAPGCPKRIYLSAAPGEEDAVERFYWME